MLKFILLILLAVGGWYFWRRLSAPRTPVRAPQERLPERMVACAWCGVNVPEGDALRSGERNYCCAEHRSAAENKSGD